MFLREIKYSSSPQPNFNDFPFNLEIFNKSDFKLNFPKPVTIIVGENGSGKSTLLEAIAIGCGFNVGGGSKNNFYQTVNTESKLADYLTLVWNFKINSGFFLRAESFYNFASEIDNLRNDIAGGSAYEPYGGKSLHHQSHGESFMSLFKNRFREGIFILDEPEAALSPNRQIEFLVILNELVKKNKCQFIISTHSPILMSYPNAQFYQIDNGSFKSMNYKNSPHYILTKDFLDNPESFHRHLFN